MHRPRAVTICVRRNTSWIARDEQGSLHRRHGLLAHARLNSTPMRIDSIRPRASADRWGTAFHAGRPSTAGRLDLGSSSSIKDGRPNLRSPGTLPVAPVPEKLVETSPHPGASCYFTPTTVYRRSETRARSTYDSWSAANAAARSWPRAKKGEEVWPGEYRDPVFRPFPEYRSLDLGLLARASDAEES